MDKPSTISVICGDLKPESEDSHKEKLPSISNRILLDLIEMNKKDIILLHKKEIRNLAGKMQDKADFLSLLNYVRKLECEGEYRPYSMKRLDYLCNSNLHVEKRYHSFEIPKKSGKPRKISAPCKGLKSILKTLNIIFECIYTPSSAATGFTNGLSIVDNARVHVGKNYVLNIDLKDFFTSIHQARVWARLQLPPFSFTKEVASVVAGLCCIQMKDETSKFGVLPQGAPTSPLLTNAICDKLDRRLLGLAKRFNLQYTRYADDISFSSMHSVYSSDGDFFPELKRIIASQNFTINDDKTRLQKVGSRQEVTGIIVCEKTNVSKSYIGFIRIVLHVWEKFGRECAYARFVDEYLGNSIQKRTNVPSMEEVLRGKLMYLRMVKGENSTVYQGLYRKFTELLSRDCGQQGSSQANDKIQYIFSCDLTEFEKVFHTKVMFTKNANGKLTASFKTSEHNQDVSVSSKVSSLGEDVIRKNKDVVISLAKKRGQSFWLVHLRNKVSQSSQIELNLSLQEIFKIWRESGLDAAIEANFAAKKVNNKAEVILSPIEELGEIEIVDVIEIDDIPDDVEKYISMLEDMEEAKLL